MFLAIGATKSLEKLRCLVRGATKTLDKTKVFSYRTLESSKESLRTLKSPQKLEQSFRTP